MKSQALLLYNAIYICFHGGSVVKSPPVNAGDVSSIPELGKSPAEGNGNPFSVFYPGKSHEQRSLVGCSPFGYKRVGQDLAIKQKQQYIYACICIYISDQIRSVAQSCRLFATP